LADNPPLNELRWQRPTFPTPRHERVHDLLQRLISEGAAHFFADACDIIQREPPFRSTTHLVGHLIREVESALRQVLVTLPDAARHFAASGAVKQPRGNHIREIDAILSALGLSEDPSVSIWRNYTGDGPDALHSVAHRDDLRRPRAPDNDFRSAFDAYVGVLLGVLSAAEASYAQVLATLDAVCEKAAPTDSDIKTLAVHLAPGVTALSHVFDKLSASWIKPLRDLRVFADPPDVEVHADGSFSFPSWPQVRYLRRVAADAPGDVADTIEALPATRNESVHLTVIEAATALPPEHAARVARHELPWIGDTKWTNPLVPKVIGQLVVHLWSGAERATALEVLRAALALNPPGDESWNAPEARTSAWSYAELAKATLPPIAADDSPAAIAFLLELITQAKGERHFLLRRRVDAPGHPGLDEPLEILFAHLRDLLLAEAAHGSDALRAIVTDLERKGSAAFDRLALHVLRVHGAFATDLVVERASDPSKLSAGDRDDEMTLMVRDRFPDLDVADRERVFNAIRETTTPEWLREEFGERLDHHHYAPPGQRRLLKWLHLLRDHLTTEQRHEYERLLVAHGAPASRSSRVQFGPNPPRRAAELADLQDDELLTYIREWEPESEDSFEPSRSGLGRELQTVVEGDAARFCRLARDFRGHHPAYVGNVVWGLLNLTKRLNEWNAKPEDGRGERPEALPAADVTLDWSSILDLVEWTAMQKTTSEAEGADDDWTWARRMAVDLAEEVFVATTSDPSLPWRAWEVIQSLLSDPDPTSQREAKTGHDDATFAINTVRGQALHAAVRISTTWKRRGGKPELLDSVRRALEERAKPDVEPSLAIRSVLAMRFTHLCVVDEGLAKELAVALFGIGAPDDAARITAWGSFLKWNEPWPGTYRLLDSAYEAALQRLGGDEAQDKNLGKHLVWLAARGGLDFRVAGNQLQRFVAGASAAARHSALDDLGRAIHRTKEVLADDVRERLCALWDWWAALSLASGDASDLTAFGWWFSDDHFDASWSLQRLNEVLSATGGAIDWDHAVIDKIAKVVESHPSEAAAALARFIDASDQWQSRRNATGIRAILTKLRDTAMSDAAHEMASRLVARGWLDFRDLMEKPRVG